MKAAWAAAMAEAGMGLLERAGESTFEADGGGWRDAWLRAGDIAWERGGGDIGLT